MKIVHTKRNNCRLCEENFLELVVPLEPTPVAEKYLSKDQLKNEELVCPLDLYMCKSCGHVQLLDIIGILQKAFSTITNPGSSHKEERIKHLQFLIKGKIFFL